VNGFAAAVLVRVAGLAKRDRRLMHYVFFALIGAFFYSEAVAAPSGRVAPRAIANRSLKARWLAQWITHPAAPKNEFGVWLFRKRFELAEKPARYVVHVAADTRYRLFVNGEPVSFGPQRSDIWVSRYDTVDLAPWLKQGANVIAVRVWSYGDWTPYSYVGARTGLLVQGETDAEAAADTGTSWKVARDEGYTPSRIDLKTYIVIGPNLRVDGTKHVWGWEGLSFDDSDWSAPRLLGHGAAWGWGTDLERPLMPRNIPAMEETPVRFAKVRRAQGVKPAAGFVRGVAPLVVPARAKASVLLDHGVETNAFPQLVVGGGRGAQVRLTYAEALVDDHGAKGNRNEIEGKKIVGVSDEFVADGGERRTFSTLEFRTYRYVQMDIETGDEPLRVDDVFGVFAAYPFKERGSFESDDPELKRIWDTGWRTARLCAFETYVDCPYYEQLQYVGDTRIQALISLYVSGDDRLMRNAIELFDRSRIAEGLTQSRYPSVTPQLINTFSLFWVDMVHDYWMHRSDAGFVRGRLAGIEAVLNWFEKKTDPKTGLLGPLEYWTFVDWTHEWEWREGEGIGGEPEGAHTGGSAIVSLQLAGTLLRAAELARAFDREAVAERYEAAAAGLKAAVVKTCWDEQRRMFADTPEKRVFSQHVNAFAVLSGAIEGEPAKQLMRRVVDDRSIVQASTYFRFYVLRAMKRAGLGDAYLDELGPWRTMLASGLTTFAEKLDPTRSDCHAWSASPVYEMLATVCGIEPASPGFATVRIQPHLGKLTRAEGVVPHPRGEIRVTLMRQGSGVRAELTLPEGVSGEFVWNGQRRPLQPGPQTVTAE
jgi:hypothetical protein